MPKFLKNISELLTGTKMLSTGQIQEVQRDTAKIFFMTALPKHWNDMFDKEQKFWASWNAREAYCHLEAEELLSLFDTSTESMIKDICSDAN